MRIPLSVEGLYIDRKGAWATFFIQIPKMRVARALTAVVDTGSPFTSISPRDALALGLPFGNWQSGEPAYLAGFRFYRHPLEATLSFKDANSNLVRFRQGIIVLVPTKMDKNALEQVQSIPSLVGTDFLEDQGLTLVFDPQANRAYLEKQVATPATASAQ